MQRITARGIGQLRPMRLPNIPTSNRACAAPAERSSAGRGPARERLLGGCQAGRKFDVSICADVMLFTIR